MTLRSVIVGQPERYTGWADYSDTQYATSNSPAVVFSVTADTDTLLPNNAGVARENQLPIDITSFYDGTKVLGVNGDAYNITVEFDAETDTAQGAYVELWIDIGGAVGQIYRGVMTTFPKGNGVTVGCIRSFCYYTLDTWEANGGALYVRANEDVDIYDIRYVITRLHKAG